jgi:hypothetical protein
MSISDLKVAGSESASAGRMSDAIKRHGRCQQPRLDFAPSRARTLGPVVATVPVTFNWSRTLDFPWDLRPGVRTPESQQSPAPPPGARLSHADSG